MLSEVSAAEVIGGAERVLREQALALRERGHEIAIVTRAPSLQHQPQASISGISEYRYPVASTNELGFVLSSVRGSLRVFDLAASRLTPDAIVIHQSLAGLGPVLGRGPRGRFVYLCLSLAHEEYQSRRRHAGGPGAAVRHAVNAVGRLWTERLTIRRCVRVIVLSEFMLQRVVSVHGVASDKVRLVPGGVDAERFRPAADRAEVRRRLKLPVNETILFTVRNLVPRMGLDNLLEAMALLRRQGSDTLLLIGGDGPLRSALQATIQRLQLADFVRLIGFVPDSSLPAYYQAADLALLPTQELEGFGLITLESLACGTPILGTPVGAIPEVLNRIDLGLIASGSDAPALAAQIGRLLSRFRQSPGEHKRLALKGRALVEKEYTWRRHAEQLETVLQDACVPAALEAAR